MEPLRFLTLSLNISSSSNSLNYITIYNELNSPVSTYTNDTNAADDILTDIVNGTESQNNTTAIQTAQAIDVATVSASTTTVEETLIINTNTTELNT